MSNMTVCGELLSSSREIRLNQSEVAALERYEKAVWEAVVA